MCSTYFLCYFGFSESFKIAVHCQRNLKKVDYVMVSEIYTVYCNNFITIMQIIITVILSVKFMTYNIVTY